MFFLMICTFAFFTTGQELFLFIVKMITEDVSVVVEQINIIGVFSKLLKGVKEHNMLIIKSYVLKWYKMKIKLFIFNYFIRYLH